MKSSVDNEKIRQAVEAALARLEYDDNDRPVIVVLNHPEFSQKNHAAGGISEVMPRAASDSSHPGLQRFQTLENDTSSSVPRPCFMEPDRECVHSGACEMRGY